MRARMRVYLNDRAGTVVSGKIGDLTQEEIDEGKASFAEIFGSKDADGWQVNIESENGSWACFPKQSVLYVELEVL